MADRRLQVFHAVAKHLSFTKAAEALFMTQPAVTFQIRQLEEHFNTRLFDRAHGRIALTPAGTLAEADALVASQPFAAVVVDRQLPDGDGCAWAGALAARHEYAGRLLLISDAAINIGVACLIIDAFLHKPGAAGKPAVQNPAD